LFERAKEATDIFENHFKKLNDIEIDIKGNTRRQIYCIFIIEIFKVDRQGKRRGLFYILFRIRTTEDMDRYQKLLNALMLTFSSSCKYSTFLISH